MGNPYPITSAAPCAMRSFTIGLAIGLGTLTLLGILLFHAPQPAEETTQLNAFRMLLTAYTPLLTPLSSALGAPSLGGGPRWGVLPLLTWLATAGVIGLALRDPPKSAKSTFASASIVLLLWIASAFIAAPTWGDQTSWVSSIDAMASDLLLYRPIDLLLTLLLPPAASALTASILGARKAVRDQIYEEDYLFP